MTNQEKLKWAIELIKEKQEWEEPPRVSEYHKQKTYIEKESQDE